MLDRDTTTYYTSGMAQKAGDWIGVDLRTIRDVSEISILQGRNSVDDVDYFDHAILEYSEDGKIWKPYPMARRSCKSPLCPVEKIGFQTHKLCFHPLV